MKKVLLSDMTLAFRSQADLPALSFREKIELARFLDRLGTDYIELSEVPSSKSDLLLAKALAGSIQSAALSLPVSLTDGESVERCMEILQEASSGRLRLPVPISTVQMEYSLGLKPEKLLKLLEERIHTCRAKCQDVELVLQDASRSEEDFLTRVIQVAVGAGVTLVSYCDDAGCLLPEELGEKLRMVRKLLSPDCALGVCCGNFLYLAEACALQALQAGVEQINVCFWGEGTVSGEKLNALLQHQGSRWGVQCSLHSAEIHRLGEQIRRLCQSEHSKASPFDSGVRPQQDNRFYTLSDDISTIRSALHRMGHELSSEDENLVYAAFAEMAARKDSISERELEAIVATAAMQVPASYTLESYVVNACNLTNATAHVRLQHKGQLLDGLSIGDGPIDAVFLAIEQIIGCHYELDDFQIRAVTEGTEAMGETIVRLRSQGRVYGGRGISTDIVGSGVQAYLNALNKIVFEENEI